MNCLLKQIDLKRYKLIFGKILKIGACYLALAIALLSNSYLYSQQSGKKITKQSALEAFSNGEYETALDQFSELSNQFSLDPVYKYYMGACLVSMKTDPIEAKELLNDAIRSSAAIKSVPSDSWFYLGRAQQMSGDFANAINSFETFEKVAGRKNARSLGVQDFIKQCSEKTGQIQITERREPEKTNVQAAVIPATVVKPEVVQVKVPVIAPKPQLIEDIPEAEDKRLDSALDLQYKADSVRRIADGLRKEMNSLPWDKRVALQSKISTLDSLALVFQNRADNQYFASTITTPAPVPNIKVNTVAPAEDLKVNTQEVVVSKPSAIVLSDFEVDQQNLSITTPVPVNAGLPAGLVYTIQLAVFRNPVGMNYFKGLGPVNGIKAEGSDLTYYYVGVFRLLDDATRSLTEVKNIGFRDAFIVSFVDNKTVSAERAKILEKEWGNKPLYNVIEDELKNTTVVAKDTIQSSLLFRVEVMRSPKVLEDEITEDIRIVAGNKGFDILNEKGFYICLIGKFLNFETAKDYADLLIRNGYKEARVAAYIGRIEIPVDTALQLFEK